MERFLNAQEQMYNTALRELEAGKKTSHWMWYIFPQLRGLGKSLHAMYFGIANLHEAKAYLAHPILGSHLRTCCKTLLTHKDKTAEEILGDLDAMKLRSSMTLFAAASDTDCVFHEVLRQFYHGQADAKTTAILMTQNTPRE